MDASAGAWPAEAVRVDVGHGLAYWSVLAGPLLAPVEPMDHFLRHLRFARGAAESTTKSYAGHLKRFESWRAEAGLSWEAAARDIAGYVIRLRTTPRSGHGRGYGRLPTGAALAPALAAIHGFYRHAVDIAAVDQAVLGVLFELAELRLGGASAGTRLRPRLRVDARPSNPAYLGPASATTNEVAAMLAAARTARDACIIAFLSGLGLRVGQVASLWREDVHLVPPGRRIPGCAYAHGPHVHVVRRDGHPRGAISKARGANVVPVPPPVELCYAQWLRERQAIAGAQLSPWAFVSFSGPANNEPGRPLSTRRLSAPRGAMVATTRKRAAGGMTRKAGRGTRSSLAPRNASTTNAPARRLVHRAVRSTRVPARNGRVAGWYSVPEGEVQARGRNPARTGDDPHGASCRATP